MNPAGPHRETWEELQALAKETLDTLIVRLPEELRVEALRIGYRLRKRDPDEDLLGSYCHAIYSIELYLEAIREDCGKRSRDFCKEVERTYLHEFGHHLGLEEDGLEKYGL